MFQGLSVWELGGLRECYFDYPFFVQVNNFRDRSILRASDAPNTKILGPQNGPRLECRNSPFIFGALLPP